MDCLSHGICSTLVNCCSLWRKDGRESFSSIGSNLRLCLNVLWGEQTSSSRANTNLQVYNSYTPPLFPSRRRHSGPQVRLRRRETPRIWTTYRPSNVAGMAKLALDWWRCISVRWHWLLVRFLKVQHSTFKFENDICSPLISPRFLLLILWCISALVPLLLILGSKL